MFKLISITAIAVGALLIALLSMETSRPGRPPSQRAVAVQIPQKKILRLAGEFHVRLLVAASERLDSTVMRDFGKVAGGQHLANEQEGLRPGSAGAR